jgi:hypothetical protein
MIIRSARPESNFYLLDKTISEDKKLSWAARGLLIFLLGKPDNWRVSVEYLSQQTNESAKKTGKQGVYSLLDELIAVGYVVRSDKQAHDEKTGFLLGYDYVVYDSPCRPQPCKVEPCKVEPCKAEPCKAEPCKANPPLISNELEQVLNKTSNDLEQGMNNINSAEAQKTKNCGLQDLILLGVDKQVANDWLSVRKAKRSPLTKTALDAMQREADKANITLAEAVAVCAENGWQGFKCEWYQKLNNKVNNQTAKHFEKTVTPENAASANDFVATKKEAISEEEKARRKEFLAAQRQQNGESK